MRVYTCNSPDAWKGHPFLSFDRTQINCVWFNWAFVISISVASSLVMLTICIIIYRNRWWILFTCCRLKCHGSSSQKKYLSSDKYKFEIELAVKLKTDGIIVDVIFVNVSVFLILKFLSVYIEKSLEMIF